MTLNPPETPTLTAQEQEVADLKQQLADAQGDIKVIITTQCLFIFQENQMFPLYESQSI